VERGLPLDDVGKSRFSCVEVLTGDEKMTCATPRTVAIKPKKKKKVWSLLLLAIPLMALVVLFQYVPLFGWILSVFEYKPGTPIFENEFVGLKYFKLIFASKDMARAMGNTLVFSAIKLVLLVCPMLFAVLLNEISGNRYRRCVQTLTTLPYFVSWIIVYSLSFSLFSSEGLITSIFGMKKSLLIDKDAVYGFQSALGIWKNLGWDAIIYIAAITGIPQELYEAAAADGAGRVRMAIHITMPELKNTFLVLLLMFVGNFINSGMDQHYAFSNNLVIDRIETLELYTYRLGLQQMDYSFSTAIGIFKSVISVILLFGTNALAKKVRGETIV
jgi:ABC-type polysaccharide transport system permease subunit